MEGAPHLLVVDDDREIRDLLSRFLRKHGFRVTAAADGRRMREALATGRFDLLVLDLMLPGEDGLSLCRRLRAESDLPVIMLTAMGEETDRIVGLELGADDYVAKPFNPRELLARIRAVLRRPPGRRGAILPAGLRPDAARGTPRSDIACRPAPGSGPGTPGGDIACRPAGGSGPGTPGGDIACRPAPGSGIEGRRGAEWPAGLRPDAAGGGGTGGWGEMVLAFEGWRLDRARRELRRADGTLVPLTAGEYELLLALAERPGRVLSRDQLLDLTRGRELHPFDRSVDVQLSRLRRKIEDDPKEPRLIKTVRGGGYVFAARVGPVGDGETGDAP